MIVEEIVLNEQRGVKLTAYIQEVKGEFVFEKRPAMIVLPGGGYAFCSDREADPVALGYASAGYQTFILRYTLKDKAGWPYPLEDYEQTMELIKENAEKWHVLTDKIAVVGFSAGGHLASAVATMSKNRPAAAVLVYPAVQADILSICEPDLPLTAECVTEDTCPCFIVAARNDGLVNVTNSLVFQMALEKHHIPFESHIYALGDHGFSTGSAWITAHKVQRSLMRWVEDSIEWLDLTLGKLTREGFIEPDEQTVKELHRIARKISV